MLGWRPNKTKSEIVKVVLPIVLLGALIFVLYFWRLGSLTKGLSPAEVNGGASSSSLQAIINDPVYGPYKILDYLIQKIFGYSALALRSVSAALAVLFIFCFYQLVKGWFGKLIGFFATLLFATTPWFILLARNGGPEISLLMPIVVLASYYWLVRSNSRAAWAALLVSSSLTIYLPGGILLIGLGSLMTRQVLNQSAKKPDARDKAVALLVLALILAPLVYGIFKIPSDLKALLLIPSDWPSVWVGLKSTVWQGLALFWRTPVHADFIIGRLPMFSGGQIALAFFGGFALFRLARSKLYLLLGMTLFGVVAAGVNRNLIFLTFALPAIVLSIAGGLRYLYMQWRGVFPKNPLPKYLALALVALLCATQAFYGLRYSLVAWPNTSATRSTYVLK